MDSKIPQWIFDDLRGSMASGPNAGPTVEFRGNPSYYIAREALQNIMDAHDESSGKPVEAEFSVVSMPAKDIPGAEHLGEVLSACAVYLREKGAVDTAVEFEKGSEKISKNESINLADLGATESELVDRKYLADIIEARVEEIFYKIDAELKKLQRSGLLPAGVVFVGGGSKLSGLVEAAKKYLRLPASLGYPMGVYSVTEKVNDLGFATAIGLLKWGGMMGGNSKYNNKKRPCT